LINISRLGYNIRKVLLFFREDEYLSKYFGYWVKSLFIPKYANKYPWITFGAIDWLKINLNQSWEILEFGSGTSTLFFADRVTSVCSVEHDSHWEAQVQLRIKEKSIKNIELYNYSDAFKFLEDNPEKVYDLILIDGVERIQSFECAVNHLKRGGFIILDNAERFEYNLIHDRLKSFEFYEFRGVSPFNMKISLTKIWRVA